MKYDNDPTTYNTRMTSSDSRHHYGELDNVGVEDGADYDQPVYSTLPSHRTASKTPLPSVPPQNSKPLQPPVYNDRSQFYSASAERRVHRMADTTTASYALPQQQQQQQQQQRNDYATLDSQTEDQTRRPKAPPTQHLSDYQPSHGDQPQSYLPPNRSHQHQLQQNFPHPQQSHSKQSTSQPTYTQHGYVQEAYAQNAMRTNRSTQYQNSRDGRHSTQDSHHKAMNSRQNPLDSRHLNKDVYRNIKDPQTFGGRGPQYYGQDSSDRNVPLYNTTSANNHRAPSQPMQSYEHPYGESRSRLHGNAMGATSAFWNYNKMPPSQSIPAQPQPHHDSDYYSVGYATTNGLSYPGEISSSLYGSHAPSRQKPETRNFAQPISQYRGYIPPSNHPYSKMSSDISKAAQV